MTNRFNRRDFLKLGSLIPLYILPQKYVSALNIGSDNTSSKNIIVLVFDAWSAYNTSIYGYERETMPKLAQWLDQAIIYHNHYASANKTTPGTSSLLTGTLPWTNKAIKNFETPTKDFIDKNIFHLFGDRKTIAYSHNHLVDIILSYFSKDISLFKKHYELYLKGLTANFLYKNDYDIASLTLSRMERFSLILGTLVKFLFATILNPQPEELLKSFPLGLPTNFSNYFTLEEAIDWVFSELTQTVSPYLTYFHVLPPHAPYNTRKEFIDVFKNDNYRPLEKEIHRYAENTTSDFATHEETLVNRKLYDEFILYVDSEIDRLFNGFKSSGIFENSIVILTSDHGEMFERGLIGHSSRLLYEPLVRVPLMIWDPAQKERVDIHTPTSCIDLLPTLLSLNDVKLPDWLEGEVLPPYNIAPELDQRPIYSYAGETKATAPIKDGTIMMRKGDFKVIVYFNQIDLNVSQHDITYEVYNVTDDPEELNDLYASTPEDVQPLVDEVLDKLFEFVG